MRGCATAVRRDVMDELMPVPKATPKSLAIFVKGVWSICYRPRFADAVLAAWHHDWGALLREHIERVIWIRGPLCP
jgi:hypothetical protein